MSWPGGSFTEASRQPDMASITENRERTAAMNKNWEHRCLDGEWDLFIVENEACRDTAAALTSGDALRQTGCRPIRGKVPGNFELDMQREGLLPDLFTGENPLLAQKLENRHLWYVRRFVVEEEPGEGWFFVFEGIDTLAQIYLNGRQIGEADNMLIAHEFSAVGLRRGENELTVHIRPAFTQAREECFEAGVTFHQPYNAESLTVRKAPHMYGWDIMPRILSGGLWRSVYLLRKPADRIEDIYLPTIALTPQRGTLHWYYRIHADHDDIGGYTLKLTGVCGDSVFTAERRLWHTEGRTFIHMDNPKIWWPRDMGEAHLYEVTAELYYHGEQVDTLNTRTGFRTIRLERSGTTDENGSGEFCFIVNGEKMFIRGTNWVPMDAFHSRDRERMPKALGLLWESNCNMVRCWGGNVYEDHAFFDWCDEHGIAVWQDFAMACACYPQDDGFCRRLQSEAEAVVRKLRGHASLFLWVGDNECDITIAGWHPLRRDPNKNLLTREVLPRVLERMDPFRPYLPSSPYISPAAYAQGKEKCIPEQHLWGPRRYFKADFYSRAICHFASETGYHGCPAPESLRRFLSPGRLWPWRDNPEWQLHATCMETTPGAAYATRVPVMENQIRDLFGFVPEDVQSFALASQITQAEAVKYFIERFRQGKWRRTGIIWWNLIDGWPQFSDAVVDYYYRRKLAYFFIQRSQEPVCLLFREPSAGRLELAGVNDRLAPVQVTYTVTDLLEGREVLHGAGTLAPNAAGYLQELPYRAEEQHMYLIEWELDGKAYKNHYLSGEPTFPFEDCLSAYRRGGLLTAEGFDQEQTI